MGNFFEILVEVLKSDERFFTEGGILLRNKVYESAMNMDAGLIGLLLGNDETRKRFFTDVNGTFVFDKVGFGWVVNNRQFLPDSYTRFKNRIGLTDSRGDMISASNDVVLSFPYKDCVLEGGQKRNKTMSACRISHPASGAVAESQEERSFDQNKKIAFRRLAQHPRFVLWHRLESARRLGRAAEMENNVEQEMLNIKVEVQKDGRWVDERSE